jgi:hypothetical protein
MGIIGAARRLRLRVISGGVANFNAKSHSRRLAKIYCRGVALIVGASCKFGVNFAWNRHADSCSFRGYRVRFYFGENVASADSCRVGAVMIACSELPSRVFRHRQLARSCQ